VVIRQAAGSPVEPPASVSPVLCVAVVLDVDVVLDVEVLDVEVLDVEVVLDVDVGSPLVGLAPLLVGSVLALLDASTVLAPGEAGPQAVSPRMTSSERVAAMPARMSAWVTGTQAVVGR